MIYSMLKSFKDYFKKVLYINKFRSFMYGKYGTDQLSIALMILSLILSLLLRFSLLGWLSILAYIPLGIAVFRTFSTHLEKRYQENQLFLKYWQKCSYWLSEKNQNFKDHQTYKYFKCPSCKQKLRAPRGKGKIQITCQRCKKQFFKKV